MLIIVLFEMEEVIEMATPESVPSLVQSELQLRIPNNSTEANAASTGNAIRASRRSNRLSPSGIIIKLFFFFFFFF